MPKELRAMAHFTVTCPHCKSLLEIDREAQVVVAVTPPEEKKAVTSLEERLKQIEEEKRRAADKLAEAMRAEQAGAKVREEKFRKLLAGVDPEAAPDKPLKDVDLD
jgi:glutaredoxin